MIKEELDFLRESNNVEDEWDDLALQDAILAWEYVKEQEKLTQEVVLETHRLLMQSRDTISDKDKGVFRDRKVYIGGHEGKPFYIVPDLINQWLIEANERSNDEESIKGNHCFYEAIHPFLDGNGRSGRLFMNWQRIKVGLPILIIKEKEKFEYYKWFL